MLANSRQGDRAFLHTAEDEVSGRAVWKLVESAPDPDPRQEASFCIQGRGPNAKHQPNGYGHGSPQ